MRRKIITFYLARIKLSIGKFCTRRKTASKQWCQMTHEEKQWQSCIMYNHNFGCIVIPKSPDPNLSVLIVPARDPRIHYFGRPNGTDNKTCTLCGTIWVRPGHGLWCTYAQPWRGAQGTWTGFILETIGKLVLSGNDHLVWRAERRLACCINGEVVIQRTKT